jgi:hypothetical protein
MNDLATMHMIFRHIWLNHPDLYKELLYIVGEYLGKQLPLMPK